ncbi:nucleoside hydrolase-like domain-containing protein [Solirubrobacter deserti]|uniref:DUF1593 domain-containing protein n=1 Tax=Solirubrobacter deserti TaxID=2282478 RepID=A0ABT4RKE6_9ACTN|nr:nucleoside hydrolase-like domain-containing protein [Solirubrobacter deserti]MDA0138816.1 DUF1593 domain-containing protein [Solirubrobacter deserti]
MRRLLLVLFAALLFAAPAQAAKPRTILTTDGEVDDIDTMIRWFLYANEMEPVGLVYSSSQWHWKGDGKGTLFTSPTNPRYGTRTDLRWVKSLIPGNTNPDETWIQELIDKYAESYDTLKTHAPGYPTPEHLKSLVRIGNIEFEGEMAKDTPGSDLIKQVLLDEDPSPVYLQIWGGTNTVARALKSIEDQYKHTPAWDAIYEKVSRKAVIYTVLDQDITYNAYVLPNWPKIRVIYNADQFWSFAYQWRTRVPAELRPYLQGPWMRENILTGHGPLMAQYYTWGDGRQIPGDPEHNQGLNPNPAQLNDFISEGDTPAYLHLMDTGLRNLDHPTWGGWGGRFTQSPTNPYRVEDLPNTRDYNPYAAATTTAVLPAAAGATTVHVASTNPIGAGLPITIGTQTRTVATVGTAQGANTTLLTGAAAGATNIKVPSVAGFVVGQKLLLNTGAGQETPTVTEVGTAGVATALAGAHVAGATNLKVASVNNLAAGDTLTVDSGGNAETVTISAVGTPGATGTGVDVTPALALAHANNAPVRDQSKPGTGITFAPALTAAHPMNTGVRGAGSGVTLTEPLSEAVPAGTTISSHWNTTYPQTRWVDVIQNDWAARADWMVKSYEDANHPPTVTTPHPDMVFAPGQRVGLNGAAVDPDGDAVTFKWWQYYEADTYAGRIAMDGADTRNASFVVPADAKPGDTIHAILEVKDAGTPALTRYQRVVVTVGTNVPGTVGGTVPATLSLSLGAAPTFDPFLPGVPKEYTATTKATIISTAGNAALSVSEPGHMTNGAFSLPQPLRVELTPSGWDGPVSNGTSDVVFKQAIGATDALRTGTYSKTLTFTLSTTAP